MSYAFEPKSMKRGKKWENRHSELTTEYFWDFLYKNMHDLPAHAGNAFSACIHRVCNRNLSWQPQIHKKMSYINTYLYVYMTNFFLWGWKADFRTIGSTCASNCAQRVGIRVCCSECLKSPLPLPQSMLLDVFVGPQKSFKKSQFSRFDRWDTRRPWSVAGPKICGN